MKDDNHLFKIFVFVLFVVVLLPLVSLAAQSCITTSITAATGNEFKGISGISDNNIIAVGKNSDIFKYDGFSWSQMSPPAGVTVDLDDVFMRADGTAYAVGKKAGGNGTVIYYNGSNWIDIGSGVIPDQDLKGVWASSASEVYAVGKNGTLVRYDGAGWSDISGDVPGLGKDLEKVWGNVSHVYVLNKDGTLYIYDRVNGTWSSDTRPCTGTGYDFKDLWIDGAGDVWLTAKKGGIGYIYKYTGPGGCSLEFTASEDLEGIHGSSVSGEIYAVGKNGTVLYYNGVTWQEMTQGSKDLKDVWLSDSGNVYYGGKNAEVTTCSGIPDPAPTCTTTATGGAENIKGISGTSDANVITVGKAGEIYQYDGNTWNPLTSNTTVDLEDVFALSSTVAYAVGQAGTVTITTDGGATWISTSPGGDDLKGVWAASTSEVYAVGKKDNLLYYDGTTWLDVSGWAGSTGNNLEEVWGDADYVYALQKDGTLYIHDRAGDPTSAVSWSSDTSSCTGTGYDFKDLWIDAVGDVWLAAKKKKGGKGYIYKYTGSGSCSLKFTASNDLEAIYGSDISGKIVAVGKGGLEALYEGGAWSESTPAAGGLKDVWMSASGIIYYGGKGGEVTVCIPPISGVDHFSISHDGIGINCQAESVTISVHDSAHILLTGYTGDIDLTTSTGHGDWSVITGVGANLVNLGGGIATYTFDGTELGSVELGLKDSFVETVDIDIIDGTGRREITGTALAAEDLDLDFVKAGFNFTTIGAQIGGKSSDLAPGAQILEIEAIRTSDSTGQCESALQGVKTIDMAFECLDPSNCSASQVSISSINIAGNNSGSVSSYTGISLDFGNNTDTTATFTMNYPDVGRLRLHARYDIPLGNGAPSGNLMPGSSNDFVVRPFGFDISVADPVATTAAGVGFTSAGTPFDVSVRAVLWQVADDPNLDGIPEGHDDNDPANNRSLADNSPALNFGTETAVENVVLTSQLFLPAGGIDPGLGGTTTVSGFVAGAATSSVQFDEVGIIEIAANLASASYLGGDSVTGRSGHIGRFYPDHFDLTLNSPSFKPACSDLFTFQGQPVLYASNPVVTVTAKNSAAISATTRNYTGAFFKIDPDDLTYPVTPSYSANQAVTILSAANAVVTDSGGGIGLLTFADTSTGILSVNRGAPVSPYDLEIKMEFNLTDTDTAAVTVANIDGSPGGNPVAFGAITAGNGISFNPAIKEVRWGRFVMDNTYGAETEALSLPLISEYFAGSEFVVNDLDFCSSFNAATDLGCVDLDGSDSLGCGDVVASGTAGNGQAFALTAPNVPGSLEFTLSTPVWLRYDWASDGLEDGPYVDNPAAYATFGIYRGNDKIINWREIVR